MKVNIDWSALEYNSYEPEVDVTIDPPDVWDLSTTLAHVIAPALVAMGKDKAGAPFVDNEDVPKKLRMPEGFSQEEGKVDQHFFDRWDYVLEEMIWAFEQLKDHNDGFNVTFGKDIPYEPVGKAWDGRIQNGLRLFAKYYRSLWT
jgi:hypothetical protein